MAGTAASPYMIEEPTSEDLAPLRGFDGVWAPVEVIRRFGGARKESEHLPRLLVACAVLQGLHRLRELADRLVALANVALPRVDRMIEDPGLEARKTELERVKQRMASARGELPSVRARAINDLERAPDGLRALDLRLLVAYAEAMIIGTEVMTKRNVRGIDFALDVAGRPPDQRFVEDWIDRALGAGGLVGILPFTPREYGRVLIVHADGRLAYDPAANTPEDEADPSSRI